MLKLDNKRSQLSFIKKRISAQSSANQVFFLEKAFSDSGENELGEITENI